MKVFIHALNSCGMRNVKVQSYRDFFLTNGHELTDNPNDSDFIFIWTCAFREDARNNSLSEILKYTRYGEKVIVGGCLPDISPELLGKYFKGRIINWRDDEQKLAIFGSNGFSVIPLTLTKPRGCNDDLPSVGTPYIDRFIQLYVSEGCSFECSYCSEKLAFPRYRSFPEDDIVATCFKEVERSGNKKVVLLADNVGEYGNDTGSSLPTLIWRLSGTIPAIQIGIQGLNPYHFIRFYNDFIEFIKSGLIIHLQIPFQSASNRMIKLMNRPYSRRDIDKVFGILNYLGFTEFDTHIIVGFPGETEGNLQESIDFAILHHPKYVMVNKFMELSGIPASNLPNKVSEDIKERRMLEVVSRLKDAGIICNYEGGELSRERFQRINKV